MIRAFGLTLAQLGDARILRVLLRSIALSLAIFLAAGALLGWAVDGSDLCDAAGFGSCSIGIAGDVAVAFVAVLAALWFLFPAVAIGVVSIFSDDIVAAVEARHYPASAAAARTPGWGELAGLGLASAARLLLMNLVALPVYAVLLVTGVGAAIAFLLVNAVALGRDLGDMVAVRHLDAAARKAWRARTRGDRFLLGLGVAALFLVPFVNLLAPVIGAAMATHLFHGSRT